MKFIQTAFAIALAATLSGALPSPDITISYTAETLEVSWTPADVSEVNDCFVLYQFVHQLNGVNVTSRLVEETSYIIPYTSCVDNVFYVTTRCRTGAVVAKPSTKTYFTRLHEDKYVQELTVTHVDEILEASWTRPPNSETCNINYRVNVRTTDGQDFEVTTTETDHNLGRRVLPPCGKFVVTVTPFDEDYLGSPRTTTLIVDPGSAGGIENLVVDRTRIAWEESQDNGECAVTYSVVVRDGDDQITTYTTANTFFDLEWIPCTVNNIAVSSAIEDIVISTLYAIHRPRPEEIGKVDNVALSFGEGELFVSWSPVVIGLCEVNYKLQHFVDGILGDSTLILETDTTFRTQYCSDNKVAVLASVDSIIGEETAYEYTVGASEPPAVTLRVKDFGSALDVSWDAVEVGFCGIQYLVEHFVNEKLIFSTTTYFSGLSLERIPCSNNEVRVTSIAAGLEGLASSAVIDISVDFISAVEALEALNTNEGLLISWSPVVEGLCEITYTVSNFNGETTTEYVTDASNYIVTRTDCVENKISVQAVELSTGITSEITSITVDVDIEMSMIRELSSTREDNGIIINWKPPINSEQCILSYIGYVLEPEGSVIQFETSDTTYSLGDVDVESCSQYIVLLVPKSSTGTLGLEMGIENIWYLTRLEAVENLKSTDYKLTWDRPLNSGLCELSYNIKISFEQEETEFISNVTSQEINMIPCVSYTFSVIAVDKLTKLESTSTTLEETGSPRILEGVSDAQHSLKLEKLTVSWNSAYAGACNLAYTVVQRIDSEITQITTVDDTTVDLQTVSCTTNNIDIRPILSEYQVFGDSFHLEVFVDLDELGSVEDIIVTQNTVSWNAPRYSGVCRLTYLVEVLDNEEVINSFETTETSAAVNFVPCYEYTVRVTPSYGNMQGIAAEKTFVTGTADHKAPTHILTVPSLASANVTLQANLPTDNSCPINEIVIVCIVEASDETVELTLPIEDNDSRIFQITIAPLVFNTHYSCVAKWLPHESEFSEPFYFYTMDIPIKELEISDVTSNEITISWEEKEGLLRYVTVYEVVITSVEPNHFVQGSCNMERGHTRFIEVPAGVFTFTFTEALPNYRYHISLITRYNIGLNSYGAVSIVNTLPDIPGVITDLAPQFIQEECEEYSAKGSFIWSPPCDINGDLNKFSIEVTTYYEVNGESSSVTQKSELLATDAREDYTFSVDIPSVNPLFRYSVSIDVYAVYPGKESTKLTYVVPPTAYAYCSL